MSIVFLGIVIYVVNIVSNVIAITIVNIHKNEIIAGVFDQTANSWYNKIKKLEKIFCLNLSQM